MNRTVVLSPLLLIFIAASAKDKLAANEPPAETAAVASGKQSYLEYCAACHGADGRGMGPTASALKTPPADLTTLTKRHEGKFPDDYVATIVRFGSPIPAHGSSDMPVWGPVFGIRDNGSELAVRRRIKNLCAYLATLQEKES